MSGEEEEAGGEDSACSAAEVAWISHLPRSAVDRGFVEEGELACCVGDRPRSDEHRPRGAIPAE